MFHIFFKMLKVISIVIAVVFVIVFLWININLINEYQKVKYVDKIDYPFIDDPRVIGTWENVGWTRKIEDFIPSSIEQNVNSGRMIFFEGGKLQNSRSKFNYYATKIFSIFWPPKFKGIHWTKGLIINNFYRTASKYVIKEIDGSIYMFVEHKAGNYSFYGDQEPPFDVFKKSDSS